VGGVCGTHERGEKIIRRFVRKVRRKENIMKTEQVLVGWDQNGS
jgi:hypothetical protein